MSKINTFSIPETVSIEVTRKHNPHCLGERYKQDPKYETIKKYIDKAINIGTTVITFTEGESLFNKDIYKLIKYVDKNKAIVNLFTWGLNLTYEKAVLLKKSGLQTLFISIYSTNPKIHDNIRGINGSYYKAINAIKICKRAGLLVAIATHINIENVDKLDELYDLCLRLNVDEFSIWESIPNIKNNKPNDHNSI